MPEKVLLPVTRLAHDGRGIGFLQPGNKVVFVAGALPGQTVECAIFRHKTSFCEATLLNIVDSSLAEQGAHCPHAHECGGCPLQSMPYAEQLKWKALIARDALQRIGGLPADKLEQIANAIVPAPATSAFRNKIELAFGLAGDELRLGFRRRSSHAVFNLEQCALIDNSAMPIIWQCRELASQSRLKKSFRFFTLRQDGKGSWHAILLTSPVSSKQRQDILALGRELLENNACLSTFTHEERKQRDLLTRGEKRVATLDKQGQIHAKSACISLQLQNRHFYLDVASFFQVNAPAAEELARVALQYDQQTAGPLLDVYCGIGAPGQLLAAGHESCMGLELDKTAVKYAQRNAVDLAHWQYRAGDASAMLWELANSREKFETALLDPPRHGLAKEALAALMQIAPGHIIYISCNPATLARDSATLKQDYALQNVTCVDMFPHTPHVECLTLWHKR